MSNDKPQPENAENQETSQDNSLEKVLLVVSAMIAGYVARATAKKDLNRKAAEAQSENDTFNSQYDEFATAPRLSVTLAPGHHAYRTLVDSDTIEWYSLSDISRNKGFLSLLFSITKGQELILAHHRQKSLAADLKRNRESITHHDMTRDGDTLANGILEFEGNRLIAIRNYSEDYPHYSPELSDHVKRFLSDQGFIIDLKENHKTQFPLFKCRSKSPLLPEEGIQRFTLEQLRAHKEGIICFYVITEDEQLHIAYNKVTSPEVIEKFGDYFISHYDLSRGEPVRAAGSVHFLGGKGRMFDSASGHFAPYGDHLPELVANAFNKMGFDEFTPTLYTECLQCRVDQALIQRFYYSDIKKLKKKELIYAMLDDGSLYFGSSEVKPDVLNLADVQSIVPTDLVGALDPCVTGYILVENGEIVANIPVIAGEKGLEDITKAFKEYGFEKLPEFNTTDYSDPTSAANQDRRYPGRNPLFFTCLSDYLPEADNPAARLIRDMAEEGLASGELKIEFLPVEQVLPDTYACIETSSQTGKSTIVIGTLRSNAEISYILEHELSHFALHRLLGRADPAWTPNNKQQRRMNEALLEKVLNQESAKILQNPERSSSLSPEERSIVETVFVKVLKSYYQSELDDLLTKYNCTSLQEFHQKFFPEPSPQNFGGRLRPRIEYLILKKLLRAEFGARVLHMAAKHPLLIRELAPMSCELLGALCTTQTKRSVEKYLGEHAKHVDLTPYGLSTKRLFFLADKIPVAESLPCETPKSVDSLLDNLKTDLPSLPNWLVKQAQAGLQAGDLRIHLGATRTRTTFNTSVCHIYLQHSPDIQLHFIEQLAAYINNKYLTSPELGSPVWHLQFSAIWQAFCEDLNVGAKAISVQEKVANQFFAHLLEVHYKRPLRELLAQENINCRNETAFLQQFFGPSANNKIDARVQSLAQQSYFKLCDNFGKKLSQSLLRYEAILPGSIAHVMPRTSKLLGSVISHRAQSWIDSKHIPETLPHCFQQSHSQSSHQHPRIDILTPGSKGYHAYRYQQIGKFLSVTGKVIGFVAKAATPVLFSAESFFRQDKHLHWLQRTTYAVNDGVSRAACHMAFHGGLTYLTNGIYGLALLGGSFIWGGTPDPRAFKPMFNALHKLYLESPNAPKNAVEQWAYSVKPEKGGFAAFVQPLSARWPKKLREAFDKELKQRQKEDSTLPRTAWHSLMKIPDKIRDPLVRFAQRGPFSGSQGLKTYSGAQSLPKFTSTNEFLRHGWIPGRHLAFNSKTGEYDNAMQFYFHPAYGVHTEPQANATPIQPSQYFKTVGELLQATFAVPEIRQTVDQPSPSVSSATEKPQGSTIREPKVGELIITSTGAVAGVAVVAAEVGGSTGLITLGTTTMAGKVAPALSVSASFGGVSWHAVATALGSSMVYVLPIGALVAGGVAIAQQMRHHNMENARNTIRSKKDYNTVIGHHNALVFVVNNLPEDPTLEALQQAQDKAEDIVRHESNNVANIPGRSMYASKKGQNRHVRQQASQFNKENKVLQQDRDKVAVLSAKKEAAEVVDTMREYSTQAIMSEIEKYAAKNEGRLGLKDTLIAQGLTRLLIEKIKTLHQDGHVGESITLLNKLSKVQIKQHISSLPSFNYNDAVHGKLNGKYERKFFGKDDGKHKGQTPIFYDILNLEKKVREGIPVTTEELVTLRARINSFITKAEDDKSSDAPSEIFLKFLTKYRNFLHPVIEKSQRYDQQVISLISPDLVKQLSPQMQKYATSLATNHRLTTEINQLIGKLNEIRDKEGLPAESSEEATKEDAEKSEAKSPDETTTLPTQSDLDKKNELLESRRDLLEYLLELETHGVWAKDPKNILSRKFDKQHPNAKLQQKILARKTQKYYEWHHDTALAVAAGVSKIALRNLTRSEKRSMQTAALSFKLLTTTFPMAIPGLVHAVGLMPFKNHWSEYKVMAPSMGSELVQMYTGIRKTPSNLLHYGTFLHAAGELGAHFIDKDEYPWLHSAVSYGGTALTVGRNVNAMHTLLATTNVNGKLIPMKAKVRALGLLLDASLTAYETYYRRSGQLPTDSRYYMLKDASRVLTSGAVMAITGNPFPLLADIGFLCYDFFSGEYGAQAAQALVENYTILQQNGDLQGAKNLLRDTTINITGIGNYGNQETTNMSLQVRNEYAHVLLIEELYGKKKFKEIIDYTSVYERKPEKQGEKTAYYLGSGMRLGKVHAVLPSRLLALALDDRPLKTIIAEINRLTEIFDRLVEQCDGNKNEKQELEAIANTKEAFSKAIGGIKRQLVVKLSQALEKDPLSAESNALLNFIGVESKLTTLDKDGYKALRENKLNPSLTDTFDVKSALQLGYLLAKHKLLGSVQLVAENLLSRKKDNQERVDVIAYTTVLFECFAMVSIIKPTIGLLAEVSTAGLDKQQKFKLARSADIFGQIEKCRTFLNLITAPEKEDLSVSQQLELLRLKEKTGTSKESLVSDLLALTEKYMDMQDIMTIVGLLDAYREALPDSSEKLTARMKVLLNPLRFETATMTNKIKMAGFLENIGELESSLRILQQIPNRIDEVRMLRAQLLFKKSGVSAVADVLSLLDGLSQEKQNREYWQFYASVIRTVVAEYDDLPDTLALCLLKVLADFVAKELVFKPAATLIDVERAKQLEDNFVNQRLLLQYFRGSKQKGSIVSQLQTLAANPSVEETLVLADNLQQGECGYPEDPQMAFYYFLSIRQASQRARYEIALSLSVGKHGALKRPSYASHLCKDAAAKGYLPARDCLRQQKHGFVLKTEEWLTLAYMYLEECKREPAKQCFAEALGVDTLPENFSQATFTMKDWLPMAPKTLAKAEKSIFRLKQMQQGDEALFRGYNAQGNRHELALLHYQALLGQLDSGHLSLMYRMHKLRTEYRHDTYMESVWYLLGMAGHVMLPEEQVLSAESWFNYSVTMHLPKAKEPERRPTIARKFIGYQRALFHDPNFRDAESRSTKAWEHMVPKSASGKQVAKPSPTITTLLGLLHGEKRTTTCLQNALRTNAAVEQGTETVEHPNDNETQAPSARMAPVS